MSDAVQGGVKHGAADGGSPIKIGGKSGPAASVAPTAVTAAQRVDAWFSPEGDQIIDERFATWAESASSTSATANSVSHASASGQTHFATGLVVTYAGAVYKKVTVYDGANVLFQFHYPSNPITVSFGRPLKFTQGNKIVVEAAASGLNGGDCLISLFGYSKTD